MGQVLPADGWQADEARFMKSVHSGPIMFDMVREGVVEHEGAPAIF